MSFRNITVVLLAGYLVLCAWLIADSGFFRTRPSTEGSDIARADTDTRANERGLILLQQTTEVRNPPDVNGTPEPPKPQLQPAGGEDYGAVGGPEVTVPIGSVDPASGFRYRLLLDSQGAAIRTATFSEFDDRNPKNPEPLVFLSPVRLNGREVLPLANADFTLLDQGRRLNLGRLSWKALDVQKLEDGVAAAFEATVVDSRDQPALRLTKTYRVRRDNYLLDITLTIENLASEPYKVQYVLTGPVGLEKESGYRMDMRKVVAGFRSPQGQVTSTRLDMKALAKADTPEKRALVPRNGDQAFLWAAAVNKYFAAILVPKPQKGQEYADWIAGKWGLYFNPDQDRKGTSGDETIGLALSSVPVTLAPAGQPDSSRTYDFQLYLGPKDKSRFDKVELYRQLGFVQTIDFMGCCCPSSIINPLAFGILAIMKLMYSVIGNYGIVIIILVLVMRLLLHPITKHSQVAMHRMSKLAPRAEEIKKKYGDNKAEMNKRLMELYREQGASPIMGMLPMFVQMPIWIALWSAIYTSIDLRGAPFLPFWITDLSAPDALIRFPAITIPLLGWTVGSLNLLPILMGVAFYLQQKLMPSQQSAAATNPQLAQQQKIMAIMMPLLFPLMLYKAPSGVNLYIMSSTFAGVIEQYVIRKHIREKEQQESKGLIPATSKTGGKAKKKKPKPFYRF